MQQNGNHVHPHVAHAGEQLRGKVQPCRRRGGAALLTRIDGLIARLVLELFMDIGRQGHLAQLVKYFLKHALVVESDPAAAVLNVADDLRAQEAAAKGAEGTRPKPPSRPDQRLPHVALQTLEQKQLHRHAGVLLLPQQARGDHLGFVDNQRVSGPEKLRQIVKMQMLYAMVGAIVHQKPAVVARFHRRLSDQLLRQFVVKVAGFHILSCSPSSGGVCGLRPRCS